MIYLFHRIRDFVHSCAACALVAILMGSCLAQPTEDSPQQHRVYNSPFDVAFSPDGRELAVSDRTAGALVVIDVRLGKVVREVRLRGEVTGVVWSPDSSSVYVAEYTSRSVAEINRSGKIVRRLQVGSGPVGLALAPKRGLLLVGNSSSDTVSLMDLATGRQRVSVAVCREPYYLAVMPDERLAVVGNRLPAGDSSDPKVSAAVTLIDPKTGAKVTDIRLPPNSFNLCGVAISPDGGWAYVTHNVGRTALPTTLIEYGWINANAVSIIDLSAKKRFVTVLIDDRQQGAANPWGVALSANGMTGWVALSGTHQLMKLDLRRLHKSMKGQMPFIVAYQQSAGVEHEGSMANTASIYSDTAATAGDDASSVELMVSDLPPAYAQGVYLSGVASRINLAGNGPRGVAVSADGKTLAVAMYYSGRIILVDADKGEVVREIELGEQPAASQVRRGEMIFHDATYCYQRWLSCSTCHPDGRADGLNWDLLNDGIGNAKNTRSLLLAHRTPPVMLSGVRPNMESAAAAGFEFALFRRAKTEDLHAVQAWIRSMQPAVSPYRIGGELSERARLGKRIFESKEAGCVRCHPEPLFSGLGMYDVGTGAEADGGDSAFDTPTLVEIWRTAPYLHHGKATTLREVFTTFNRKDRHGKTSRLSESELGALIEYLKSL